jgi:hypothetical protein
MVDARDLDDLPFDAIYGDVRQRRKPSSRLPSIRPIRLRRGEFLEGRDSPIDDIGNVTSSGRVVFLNSAHNPLKVVGGFGRPANLHQD